MDKFIFNKTTVIIIVISLLAGIIAGYFLFSKTDFSKSKSKTNITEIDILNKEINNCIDTLNICESQIEKTTELD